MKTPKGFVKLHLPDGRVILLASSEIFLGILSDRTKRKQYHKFIPKKTCNANSVAL